MKHSRYDPCKHFGTLLLFQAALTCSCSRMIYTASQILYRLNWNSSASAAT